MMGQSVIKTGSAKRCIEDDSDPNETNTEQIKKSGGSNFDSVSASSK